MHHFVVSFAARDYECDAQGIVNNAVYCNYFEHARNELIKHAGFNLHSLAQVRGEMPVVARIEIDYKYPLRGGDEFDVHTEVEASGAFRLVFRQRIVLRSELEADGKICAQAVATIAVVSGGRPKKISESIFAPLVGK